MKSNLKLSIITATFNSSATIIDAVESVNNQNYPNIEHIFIDSRSKDCTLKIIEVSTCQKH